MEKVAAYDSSGLTGKDKAKVTRRGKKRAQEVRNLFINADNGPRRLWQAREQKAYDFALNSQLTDEEVQALEEAGMPTFTINRITPIIETMKYFVTAGQPRWKAVGAEGSDAALAQVHTDVLDYCWNLYDGNMVLSRVVFDSLVKSKGYLHVIVDPDADQGMGEVGFEVVDPFDVWVSSQSVDPLERDATYQMIKKDLPRETLVRTFPQFEDLIRAAQGEDDGHLWSERDTEDVESSFQLQDMESPLKSDGTQDDMLPYYEVYEPIKIKFMNVFLRISAGREELREAMKAIDEDIKLFAEELQVEYLEKESELEEAVQAGEVLPERMDIELRKKADMMTQAISERRRQMMVEVNDKSSRIERYVMTEDEFAELKKRDKGEGNIEEAIPFYETRIKKTCVVGDRTLYEKILNVTNSPLIPLPYIHSGTVLPMSAVRPLIGKQQEINKAHQIMVHNANLGSNLRWMFAEGEIDEDEWATYSSSPGALLRYQPGMSQSGPREVLPQNINNAFFTVEQDAKTDMEYIAGIQPPSMGISTEREETYRGFLAKDEYGTRRIKSWVQNMLEPMLQHAGRVFQELAKDTYTVEKVFRLVQPNPSGSFDEREVKINETLYNDFGEEIGVFNDYANTRYDLRIVAGSTLPINRWALMEEYKGLFEVGLIDDIAFLEQTDIPNKEKIIERKSVMSQLEQRVKEMEDTIKDKDGIIQTLTRQVIQAGIKNQVQTAEMEIDREKTQTKAAEKLAIQRMEDAIKAIKVDDGGQTAGSDLKREGKIAKKEK